MNVPEISSNLKIWGLPHMDLLSPVPFGIFCGVAFGAAVNMYRRRPWFASTELFFCFIFLTNFVTLNFSLFKTPIFMWLQPGLSAPRQSSPTTDWTNTGSTVNSSHGTMWKNIHKTFPKSSTVNIRNYLIGQLIRFRVQLFIFLFLTAPKKYKDMIMPWSMSR